MTNLLMSQNIYTHLFIKIKNLLYFCLFLVYLLLNGTVVALPEHNLAKFV